MPGQCTYEWQHFFKDSIQALGNLRLIVQLEKASNSCLRRRIKKNTKVSWPVWRFEVRTNQLQNCSASNLGMVSMLVDWKSAIDESKIFTLPNFFSNKGPSGAVLVKPQRNVAVFHLLPLKMHANQHGGISIFHLFGVSHGPYDLHGTLL